MRRCGCGVGVWVGWWWHGPGWVEEYIRCSINVSSNLQNLAVCERESELLALADRKAIIEEALKAQKCAFVYLPQVDAFLHQLKVIKSRYKFFVLVGSSGTGKTQWCKGLFGDPDSVFECNCAQCPEPDLRLFRPMVHKGILFDEATPKMVIAQKKLFQAPPCDVTLGMSVTNCHSYRVFVSGIGLMICSNTWDELVAKMDIDADREWLQDNSIVVNVGTRKLWVQT